MRSYCLAAILVILGALCSCSGQGHPPWTNEHLALSACTIIRDRYASYVARYPDAVRPVPLHLLFSNIDVELDPFAQSDFQIEDKNQVIIITCNSMNGTPLSRSVIYKSTIQDYSSTK